MCFSASISYGAAAVLIPTGIYALQQARKLRAPYWVLALVPVFFGIQQAFEGRVWQLMEAGGGGEVPFALGFHFFSHFLWLWWIPLASYVVEESKIRKRVFLGASALGFASGSIVFFALLFNSEWLSVAIEGHSIVYEVSSTYRGPIDLGIPPSAVYGLIILVPLLFSSHQHLRIFGVLIALSVTLASVAYGYAFVSVWCFFAAALSLYLVFMIRRVSLRSRGIRRTSLDVQLSE